MPLDKDPQRNVAIALRILGREDWIGDALRIAVRDMSPSLGIPLFDSVFSITGQKPLIFRTESHILSVFMYMLKKQESIICLLHNLETTNSAPFTWGEDESRTPVLSSALVGVAFKNPHSMHTAVTFIPEHGGLGHIEPINLLSQHTDNFQLSVGGPILHTLKNGVAS
jgi:hypothetical protein